MCHFNALPVAITSVRTLTLSPSRTMAGALGVEQAYAREGPMRLQHHYGGTPTLILTLCLILMNVNRSGRLSTS